jgi:hypothetical protein
MDELRGSVAGYRHAQLLQRGKEGIDATVEAKPASG